MNKACHLITWPIQIMFITRVHSVVMLYSRLSVGIATLNKESYKKFLYPDRDPDPETLDPDCDPDCHQNLTDCSLGHVPPL